eukprot:6192731-Pleurochrysis_carterae.AAC.1
MRLRSPDAVARRPPSPRLPAHRPLMPPPLASSDVPLIRLIPFIHSTTLTRTTLSSKLSSSSQT